MNLRPTPALLLASGLFGLVAGAQAQYKIVEPDGRVTYTDRPAPSSAARVQPLRAGSSAASVNSNLPYELRQVAERYPVILYTGERCEGCTEGRNLLRQRGIPFVEKTVVGDADVVAFRQIEPGSVLPVLRIGTQQLRGYSQPEWRSYLDAAGYPAQSRLPADYKGVDATPLVGQTTAAAPTSRPQQPPPQQPPAALPPALESAPSGIRF